jgi:hypothetical protein
VRITGQLIDAATGTHLWADRFDGGLEDIFDLQDEVTTSVIGAISPKLEQAEIERAKRKPTEKLAAYDYFLRGMADIYQGTKDANIEALKHFDLAVEIDPNFPRPMACGRTAMSGARPTAGWPTRSGKPLRPSGWLGRRQGLASATLFRSPRPASPSPSSSGAERRIARKSRIGRADLMMTR